VSTLDRYHAIVVDQQRKVGRLVKANGVAPMRRLFDDMLTLLERDLARATGPFNEAVLRGMIAQVKLQLSRFIGVATPELGRAAQALANAAAQNAFAELARMEKAFTGAVVSLPVQEIARLRSLTAAPASMLRIHARSLARYGAHVVGRVEGDLANMLTTGQPTHRAIRQVMRTADAEWYQGERIVRTELSYAYNASHRDAIADESEALDGDLWMQWSEHVGEDGQPLDERVAVDSLAISGQVAPPGGAFTMPPTSRVPDAKGRTEVPAGLVGQTWSNPPNRPNDRAVLTPWRPHWAIPGWVWRGGQRVPIRKIPGQEIAADQTTAATADGSALTATERRLLELRASSASDRRVREELGIDQDEAHELANGVRGKLSLGDGGSLRDAGRRLRRGQ